MAALLVRIDESNPGLQTAPLFVRRGITFAPVWSALNRNPTIPEIRGAKSAGVKTGSFREIREA
jgi:hypothetical protein